MHRPPEATLFNAAAWTPALEKYGAVTHLTVALYDRAGGLACGPINATPLFEIFEEHGYHPGILQECARQCLAQRGVRPAVLVVPSSGIAVVGTSLVLEDEIVGAAVAGYVLVDFCPPSTIEALARKAGIPFRRLWEIARTSQPIPQRRLTLYGELLQVLGDAILRENCRTREYEEVTAQLTAAAAAKDEFLAVLSHELRTPLTPILGWTQMLRDATDPAQIRRAADVIRRNAMLQVRLVEDLLELTRVTRGKVTLDIRVCDLGDALQLALDAIAETARDKNIDVRMSNADGRVFVDADADRLQQILRNVISNALKFTPAGGTIAVSLATVDGNATVTIRDTGQGIAPDFLPHAFEIFRQQERGTRRTHAGLGIGLALVKRLTELQGGSVTIDSEGVGLGTAVTIVLPCAAGAPGASTDPPRAGDVLREMQGVRVLVIEDGEDSRDATRLMLEHLGAEVFVATDGIEGLEEVGRTHPDVVLCDLRMPRMDGFEFLRELRSLPHQAELPVIAVSGLASGADHKRSEAAGFEGHIDKPFDDARLIAAVGAAIARR
jgi:signal transduction histidine kinase/CheY-like chemotaxis protein